MDYFYREQLQTFLLYCDNKSLVDTVDHLRRRKRPVFVNDTMEPEWDLLQAITHTLQQMGPSVQVRHVKGHQNDNINVHKLPLPAQLNVEADKLASDFQTKSLHGHLPAPLISHQHNQAQIHFAPDPSFMPQATQHPSSPTLTPQTQVPPSAAAELPIHHPPPLAINGSTSPFTPATSSQQTITRKVRHTLREIFAVQRTRTHIKLRESWSEATLQMVDWEAHGRAVSNTRETKTFITKLIYDLLPTGKRVYRYKKYYDHHCPSCEAEEEDRDHLWQCQCAKREQWRTQFLISLRHKCTSAETSPVLTSLLVGGIRSAFDNTAFQVEGSEEIQALAAAQDHLGWHQVLLGRFSLKWSEMQLAYLQQRGKEVTKYNHGTTWLCQLIHHIWKDLKKLWTLRNEDRHGKDEETKMACRYTQTRRETEWLYSLKEHCLPEHREQLFYSSIQEHLHHEQSELQMRDWIHLSKKAILSSVEQFNQQATARTPAQSVIRRQQLRRQTPTRQRRSTQPTAVWQEQSARREAPTPLQPQHQQQRQPTLQRWFQRRQASLSTTPTPPNMPPPSIRRSQQAPTVQTPRVRRITRSIQSRSQISNSTKEIPDNYAESLTDLDCSSADERDTSDEESNSGLPKVKMKGRC